MIQQQKRKLFLQLLLESFASKEAPKIWRKLSYADQEIPKDRIACPLLEPISSNLLFLKRIHYTWLAHYIAHLPPNYQPIAAHAFPEFIKIMKTLNKTSVEEVEKHGEVNPYLYHLLIEKMGLQEKLPPCFLPPSPYKDLLQWDRIKILSLIDLLPLSDAAKEIKHIVDKNKLLLIYSALTEEQKSYIKQCMVTKHATSDLNLNLKNWQGTKERLKIHLHKLGLNLFYKGLQDENPDFLYYLSHILDIGRGKPLLNLPKSEDKKEFYTKNLNQCYKFISDYEKPKR